MAVRNASARLLVVCHLALWPTKRGILQNTMRDMVNSLNCYGPPVVIDYILAHLICKDTKMGPQFWELPTFPYRFGSPIIRAIVFWGLDWGPLFWENCQISKACKLQGESTSLGAA